MKKKEKMVQYIPVEIASKILRRLPEVSQVRFKIVCKEWRSIINGMLKLDMLFIYPNLATSPHQLPCAIPLCSMSKTSTSSSSYTIHAKSIDVELNKLFVERTHCNGFLLLHDFNYTNVALWSPFSGERIELPSIVGCYDVLGYDLKSNDYKLVACQDDSEAFIIYSLKSQAWHNIVDFPMSFSSCTCPVFANDAFYWLIKGQLKFIISLHLSTETVTQLPGPPCCPAQAQDPWNYIVRTLYALEGCLFLVCTHHDERYQDIWNLWIWKDCETGNGKGWNKLITLAKKDIPQPMSFRDHLMIHPVAYVQSKEQVVIRHEDKFMWFDLKNNKFLKTVTIEGIGMASCQVLPASHGWFSENHENGLKLDIKTSSSPCDSIPLHDDI